MKGCGSAALLLSFLAAATMKDAAADQRAVTRAGRAVQTKESGSDGCPAKHNQIREFAPSDWVEKDPALVGTNGCKGRMALVGGLLVKKEYKGKLQEVLEGLKNTGGQLVYSDSLVPKTVNGVDVIEYQVYEVFASQEKYQMHADSDAIARWTHFQTLPKSKYPKCKSACGPECVVYKFPTVKMCLDTNYKPKWSGEDALQKKSLSHRKKKGGRRISSLFQKKIDD